MITVLCIVVYNRIDNLKHWLDCLKLCPPVKTVVVHNVDKTDEAFSELFNISINYPDFIYIKRKNIGFDIGAFQDVCKNRLPGFPEYDKLLWCTDDTFPMAFNFVQRFESAMTSGVGVACMEVSKYVRPHIRTTGFMITKQVAERLTFPADPVITKQHCYLFEHRHISNTFHAQVNKMGLQVVQVAPRETSPMFDTGYHRRLKREAEHAAIFGGEAKQDSPQPDIVTFICPIFKSFPAIISSLIMQSNPNWQLKLIHDGPGNGEAEQYVNLINDDRIEYIETPEHRGNWGHAYRGYYLKLVTTKYVIISNPDNYYAPKFLEKAFNTFVKFPSALAVYSKQIVHNYTNWEVMQCRLARGFIDCGSVMLKTKEAATVGFNSIEHSADWVWFDGIAKKYGSNKFVSFAGCNFVHN